MAVWGTAKWGAFNWGATEQPLSGSAAAVASTSGHLTVPQPLAGLAVCASSTAARLTLPRSLVATIAVVSATATGRVSVADQLTGEVAGIATVGGQPTVRMLVQDAGIAAAAVTFGHADAFGRPRRGLAGEGVTGRIAAGRRGTVRS